MVMTKQRSLVLLQTFCVYNLGIIYLGFSIEMGCSGISLSAFYGQHIKENYYLNSYLQDTDCSLATKNTVVHFAAELLQPLQYLLKQQYAR